MEVKQIKIFVAGAINLDEERQELSLMIGKMNYDNCNKGIVVYAPCYKDLGDWQDRYNTYIKEEADIVIFIIRDYIGDEAKKEFIVAADALRKNGQPEVIICLHKSAPEEQKGIVHGLMEGLPKKQYAVVYDSVENLGTEVRRRIEQYIKKEEICAKEVSKWQDTTKKWIQRSLYGLCAVLAAVFIVWGYSLWRGDDSNRGQKILFAGGGSVANYLRTYSLDSTDILDVNLYADGIYANMPSGNAWTLLSEEVNRFKQYGHHIDALRFVTLCLSASRADSVNLLRDYQSNSLMKEASIIECKIGNDPLVVYIDTAIQDVTKHKSEITGEELAEILKKHSAYNIFSTSASSGTCHSFQAILPEEYNIDVATMLDTGEIRVYTEASELTEFKDGSCIIMGSEYYYVYILKKEKEGQFRKYYVIDADGKYINKTIYLYFMAFRDKDNGSYVRIPQPILAFLRKTKIVESDGWKRAVKDDKVAASSWITQIDGCVE